MGATKAFPTTEPTSSAHIENLHGVRYIEIFVFGGDPLKGDLQANVYNISLIAGSDYKSNKDSAPQAYVEGVDLEGIKKQFHAYAVKINGGGHRSLRPLIRKLPSAIPAAGQTDVAEKLAFHSAVEGEIDGNGSHGHLLGGRDAAR